MRLRFRVRPVLFACVFALLMCDRSIAATVPSGFADSVIAGGLSRPTAMALAPDGRLFVWSRAVLSGSSGTTPSVHAFVSLTVSAVASEACLGRLRSRFCDILIDDDADGTPSGDFSDFVVTVIE